ncbi:hypothetical protein SDC9_196026 [bioreactor metagenome]|uniref:Uncharacterized protein n=1 Tax=bioreactor metagenome TaxID=1076179 RepID=A0A645ID84_9ZZZZ
MIVIADDRGVDIAVTVNLRAAQKANIYVAALQVIREDIVHAADGAGSTHQGGVTDGKRQPCRPCADDAGFIDHLQVGGMGAPGQVAGQVGQPNAHEHHIAIQQQPGGVDAHQF